MPTRRKYCQNMANRFACVLDGSICNLVGMTNKIFLCERIDKGHGEPLIQADPFDKNLPTSMPECIPVKIFRITLKCMLLYERLNRA